MEFKIGDRVRIIYRDSKYYNTTGTIKIISQERFVTIELDEPYASEISKSVHTITDALELIEPNTEFNPKIRWYSKGRFSDWEEKE